MSALADAVNSYMSGNFIDGRTANYINVSANIASAVAFGTGAMLMCWDYFKNSLMSFEPGKEGKLFDPYTFGKIMLFILIIQAYPSMIKPVVNYFNSINQAYASSDKRYEEYRDKVSSELLNNIQTDPEMAYQEAKNKDSSQRTPEEQDYIDYYESQGHQDDISAPTDEHTTQKGILGSIREIYRLLTSANIYLCTVIFHSLATILCMLIADVVKFFAFYSIKLLVVLGPFAIAFSLIPGFNNQFAKWFGRLGNLLFAAIMITILDSLFMDTLESVNPLSMSGLSNFNSASNWIHQQASELNYQKLFVVIAFDIAVIALYVSPFFLSSAIIGSGDGGSMVSKAIGLGTGVATMATTAVIGSGAAVASGGATIPGSLGGLGKDAGNLGNKMKPE